MQSTWPQARPYEWWRLHDEYYDEVQDVDR